MRKSTVCILATALLFSCSEATDTVTEKVEEVKSTLTEEQLTKAQDLLNEANVLAQSPEGSPEDAVALYSKALAINPNLLEAYRERGQWRMIQDEHDRALGDYEMAVKLEPGNPDNHYYLGLCKFNLEDLEGAIPHFESTLQLDSTYTNAYYSRGLSNIRLGNKEEGCADLYRADNYGSAEVYFLMLDSLCIKTRDNS